MATLELKGWVVVHTYRESYGAYVMDILQQEGTEFSTHFSNLRHYRNRDGADQISLEQYPHNYLLAKHVEDPVNGWKKTGWERYSPCCTAGTVEYQRPIKGFEDDPEGVEFAYVHSVVGHGRWAVYFGGRSAAEAYKEERRRG